MHSPTMPKLTDDEAYDRMHAASVALGNDEAETTRANTALETCRRALQMMMFGLIAAQEAKSDEVPGVMKDPPSE